MNAQERIDRTLAIHAELREIWEAGDVFNVSLSIFPPAGIYNDIGLEEHDSAYGGQSVVRIKQLEILGSNCDMTRVTFYRPQ